MSDIRPTYDDEIDLFELIETLWDGKWLISAFIAIAILLAGSFLLIKEPVYESKIVYDVDTLPPFYSNAKAFSDFKKMFYDRSVFEDWKGDHNGSDLVFDDFSDTEVFEGFVVSRDEDDLLAALTSAKNTGSFVLVRANQLALLSDFHTYASHINRLLKSEYVLRSREELNIIESRFKDLSSSSDTIIQNLLAIDRYIVASEKGADVLRIQYPTRPEKVSPKSALTLVLSVLLGGMLGAVYVLIAQAIRNRKA
ncbi:Wzz/FepE/Etk N-terminal domain-containing protein [Alphaproteobacteria bacterium]|nr:Wzz/FepE/Etk N-terminal domain-containing protein [Alphaproteobacteria bacterium]